MSPAVARLDRPPGRMSSGPHSSTGHHQPSKGPSPILGDGTVSDRRRGELLDWWADGYRIGFEAGQEIAARRTAREWHVTAAGLPMAAIGPSWAELERRRWGPGGRAHFGDPRPGDFPGRAA
jgi:hypothetical protein